MPDESESTDPWQRVAEYLLSTPYVVEDAIRALELDLDPVAWTFERWTMLGVDCCEGCSNWFEVEEVVATQEGSQCVGCAGEG